MAALAADGPRYFPVAAAAGASLPAGLAGDVEVVERLPGSTTTDFGPPGTGGAADARPLSLEAGRRLASRVSAAWGFFDQVAGHAPLELRTGPRGGGRDRDQIVEHVLAVDFVYARELGLTLPSRASDPTGVAELRAAVVRALGTPASVITGPRGWPPQYYARRAAWHVLDHAWEIQDRSEPSGGGPR